MERTDMPFRPRRTEFRQPIIECTHVERSNGMTRTCPFLVGDECWMPILSDEQLGIRLQVYQLKHCPLWDGNHDFKKMPKREFVKGIRAMIPKSIPMVPDLTVWGGPC